MLTEWLFKLTKCIDSAKKKKKEKPPQINAEIIHSPQILIFLFFPGIAVVFKMFCFLFSHHC